MNKNTGKLIARAFPLLFAALLALQVPAAYAAPTSVVQLADDANAATNTATNTPPKGPPSKVQLNNPLAGCGIACLVGRAIKIVTGVSGSVALLMFVYGGFTWITAAGSMEKIKKGKQIFVTATIGLLIIFMAYGLVGTVLKAIGGLDVSS